MSGTDKTRNRHRQQATEGSHPTLEDVMREYSETHGGCEVELAEFRLRRVKLLEDPASIAVQRVPDNEHLIRAWSSGRKRWVLLSLRAKKEVS